MVLHVVDRNAATVVNHGDGVVDVDCDVNAVGVPSQGFVDGVVDDFIDEMMKTHLSRRSDVHCRTKPDSL